MKIIQFKFFVLKKYFSNIVLMEQTNETIIKKKGNKWQEEPYGDIEKMDHIITVLYLKHTIGITIEKKVVLKLSAHCVTIQL